MPRFLAGTNNHGAPVTALVMAGGLVQLLLILLLFTSEALDFMLDLTAALALIPYFLAAGYALKLVVDPRDVRGPQIAARRQVWWRGWPRSTRCSWCTRPGSTTFCCPAFSTRAGAVLYVMARRERSLRVFSPAGGGVVRGHPARARWPESSGLVTGPIQI